MILHSTFSMVRIYLRVLQSMVGIVSCVLGYERSGVRVVGVEISKEDKDSWLNSTCF